MRGLLTAIRTLTVVPVPGRDPGSAAAALPWFPLVGAALGGLVASIGWLVEWATDWQLGAALCMVLAETWLTGALHLDGLADVADALGAGRDRDRALTVMKDSWLGTFGAAALVLVLLSKWIAYSRLLQLQLAGLGLPVVFAGTRLAMVQLAVTNAYARPEGGTGRAYVTEACGRHLLLAVCVSALVAAGVVVAGSPVLPLLLLLAFPFALCWGAWATRRFGGVTGDVLGAAGEVLTVALLFAALALAHWLPT